MQGNCWFWKFDSFGNLPKTKLHLSVDSLKNDIITSKETNLSRFDNLGSTESQLNTLLEKMPPKEKYSLLIQSYSNSILDSKGKDKSDLDRLEDLLSDMIRESIQPDKKGSTKFLDAVASFCSVEKLSKALWLLRAGKNSFLSSLFCFLSTSIAFSRWLY